MSPTETTPLPREAVLDFDKLLAKQVLIARLSEIPEFDGLWQRARRGHSVAMEVLRPKFQEYLETLSPLGRGALAASNGELFALYDIDARNEAKRTLHLLKTLLTVLEEAAQEHKVDLDYRAKLEELVGPLAVPGLVDVMFEMDASRWGWTRVIYDSGPIEGPFRDYLETDILKSVTDIAPPDLARDSPGRIRDRMKRKVAPLGQHLRRHHLRTRIDLWVINVVNGLTYAKIAGVLTDIEKSVAVGESPYEWVRHQVQDASRLLGVSRRGRPRKGGVLRQWKLMGK